MQRFMIEFWHAGVKNTWQVSKYVASSQQVSKIHSRSITARCLQRKRKQWAANCPLAVASWWDHSSDHQNSNFTTWQICSRVTPINNPNSYLSMRTRQTIDQLVGQNDLGDFSRCGKWQLDVWYYFIFKLLFVSFSSIWSEPPCRLKQLSLKQFKVSFLVTI